MVQKKLEKTAQMQDSLTKLLSVAVSRNRVFSFEPECSYLGGWTENKFWSIFQPQVFYIYHVYSIHFSFLSFGSYHIRRWSKWREGHHCSKSISGFNYLLRESLSLYIIIFILKEVIGRIQTYSCYTVVFEKENNRNGLDSLSSKLEKSGEPGTYETEEELYYPPFLDYKLL